MKLYKRIIIFLLIVVMICQGYRQIFLEKTLKVSAADSTEITNEDDPYNDTDSIDPKTVESTNSLSSIMSIDTASQKERLNGLGSARLIMNIADLKKVRALNCVSSIIPSFESDMEALYNYIPFENRPKTKDELLIVKYEHPDQFRNFVRQAMIAWGLQVPNYSDDLSLLSSALKAVGTEISTKELEDIKKTNDTQFGEYIKTAQNAWIAGNSSNYKKVIDEQVANLEKVKNQNTIVMPIFADDLEALLDFLPELQDKPKSVAELSLLKTQNPGKFNGFVDDARINWIKLNPNYNALANSSAQTSVSVLACIADLSVNQLMEEDSDYIQAVVDDAMNATVIDIRVLKALVYLVTPKDQGGAGHWRIRVRRIVQLSSTPYSTESENIRTTLGGGISDGAICTETMTAEECGQKQADVAAENQDITVEDQNGEEYYASLTTTDSLGSTVDKTPERNISAHTEGKAFDVSEIDDVRCTLIKKKRIGGDSLSAQPARPIKLAWQTTDGYAASGGNSTDMMALMKNMASDSVKELISSMGGDVTDYEGDLSKANFNDVIGILGQAIFSELINSSGKGLSGLDVEDTLNKLGSMYFGDYLGLPREIFLNRTYDSIDDLEAIIGESALEKKIGIPYGSLDDFNIIESKKPQKNKDGNELKDAEGNKVYKPVYDLEGMMINIGLRKLEYEMSLRTGDLNQFVGVKNNVANPQGNTTSDVTLYIGERTIEKELNLAQGSLTDVGKNFSEFKRAIGDVRSKALFIDPSYMDTYVHLTPGTTKKLMKGEILPKDFVSMVGTTRMNDTLNGFTYFEANNTAFNMPTETFPVLDASGAEIKDNKGVTKTESAYEHAMKGNLEGFKAIGKHFVSKKFGQSSLYTAKMAVKDKITINNTLIDQAFVDSKVNTGGTSIVSDPNDIGTTAFKLWIDQNMTATSPDSCKITGKEVKVTVPNVKVSYTVPLTSVTHNGIFNFSTNTTEGTAPDPATVNVEQIITERKALELGLYKNDMFRMFGCAKASARSVYEKLGSKMLYTGIANKLLNPDEEIKIDLADTDPDLKSSDPKVKFYTDRVHLIKDKIKKVKDDWQKDNVVGGVDIMSHITAIEDALQDPDSIQTVTERVGIISHQVDNFKKDLEYLRSQKLPDNIDKVNATISDINQVILAVSEIFEGKPIKQADQLTIKGIKQAENTNDTSNSRGSTSTKGRLGASMVAPLIDFINGKMSVTDLFVFFGASQVESELGMPNRTLVYLVQNYERIGYSGVDALYASLGQAKIEEEFGMPAYYFQGETISNKWPDFDKDMVKLRKYTEIPRSTDTVLDSIKRVILYYHLSLGITVSFESDQQLVKYLKLSKDPFETSLYKHLIKTAKKNWQTEYNKDVSNNGGHDTIDKTLSDIAKNAEARKYNDGMRSGSKDVSMRMGFSGNVSDYKSTFTPIASTESKKVDGRLDLSQGSTRALITEKPILLKNGEDLLTNDEKNKLTAPFYIAKEGALPKELSSGLSRDALNVYLKLINKNITLNELGRQGLGSDYINANPYLEKPNDTKDSCPIDYVITEISTDPNVSLGNFRVNENRVEADKYCIYDKKGYHCFESQSESQRYAVEHGTDSFGNVLDSIAQTLGDILHLKPERITKLNADLKLFINGSIDKIFTDEEWELYQNFNELGVPLYSYSDDLTVNGSYITRIPVAELKKIFTRPASVTEPVLEYKKAVGKAEAKKVISWKLFQSIGLDIDPNMFDSSDLYDVLNGNYKSLYRIATHYVDKNLDFKPGTTELIITAANPDNLQCAIANAGATILGNVFGMDSLPIRGLGPNDILGSVGESEVESQLQLSKGTFYGKNLKEVVARIKPINFARKFKIPLTLGRRIDLGGQIETPWEQSDVLDLVGTEQGNILSKSSGPYELEAIINFLSKSPGLSNVQMEALNRIDSALSKHILSSLGDAGWGQFPLNGAEKSDPAKVDHFMETEAFIAFRSSLDGQFGLDPKTTDYLFRGTDKNNKPFSVDDYNLLIGQKIAATKMIVSGLSSLLGWDNDEKNAAKEILTNYKNFFSCNSTSPFGDCNPYYKKLGSFYDNLTTIFHFDLDEKARLDHGSFKKMLDHPDRAYMVLLDEAASRLDKTYKLEKKVYSFSELFDRYDKFLTAADFTADSRDKKCLVDVAANPKNDGYDYNAIMISNRGFADTITQEQNKKAPDVPDTQLIASAQAEIKANNQKIRDFNDQRHECEQAGRRDSASVINGKIKDNKDYFNVGKEGLDMIATGIAELIHNEIKNADYGVNMPVADIKQMVFGGEIDYLQVVGAAMAVNIIQDKVTGKPYKIIPDGMTLTYHDIKQAYFPDSAATSGAQDAAAWAYKNNEAYLDSRITAGYGQICPGGSNNFLGDIAHCDSANYPKAYNDIVGQNIAASQQGYGVNIAVAPAVSAQIVQAGLQEKLELEAWTHNEIINKVPKCDDGGNTCQEMVNWENMYTTSENMLNDATTNMTTFKQGQSEAAARSRKMFKEQLEYRMMDQALWGLDNNVFPGFTQSLIKGNMQIKTAALARYVKNGIIRGELLGFKFDGIENLDEWLPLAEFIDDWTDGGELKKAEAFDKFVTGKGFNFVKNYMSQNSSQILGFDLSPDMAGGLLVGIFKGQWGINLDNPLKMVYEPDDYTATVGGNPVKIPTLGKSIATWGLARIFNWADKALGMEPGMSFKIFNMTKDVYTAAKLSSASTNAISYMNTSMTNGLDQYAFDNLSDSNISNLGGQANVTALENLNNQLKAMSPEQLQKYTSSWGIEGVKNYDDMTPAQLGQLNATQNATKLAQIKIQVISFIVSYFFNKWAGEALAGLEKQWGLVPGSLSILTDALIGLGVTSAYIAVANVSAVAGEALMSTAMTGLYIAIAIFIITNLFGVYKMELKCTADGYYPRMGSPSPNTKDVSGIGEWDGMNNAMVQKKSIEAAQYKARRLIVDMLTAQESPVFSDLKPSQIMTGREEDVQYTDSLVGTNMCSYLGLQSIGGICGGNTLAGVWSNPQTVAWTHIGF